MNSIEFVIATLEALAEDLTATREESMLLWQIRDEVSRYRDLQRQLVSATDALIERLTRHRDAAVSVNVVPRITRPVRELGSEVDGLSALLRAQKEHIVRWATVSVWNQFPERYEAARQVVFQRLAAGEADVPASGGG